MSMIDGNFFARLAEERKRLGLSQDSIAEICGVSRKQWGNYEGGKNIPGADVLFSYAQAGADIIYLMTGSRVGSVKNTAHLNSHFKREDLEDLVDIFAHTTDEGRLALLNLAYHLKKLAL